MQERKYNRLTNIGKRLYILESKFVLDQAVKYKMGGDMGPKNREELKDSLDEICDRLGLVNGQDDRCSEKFLGFVQKIFSLPYEPVPGEKVIEEAKKSMTTTTRRQPTTNDDNVTRLDPTRAKSRFVL